MLMFHSKLFSGEQSQKASTRIQARREAGVRLSVEQLETRDLLAVFTVTNTADAGDGSLRAAIAAANDTAGADRIEFSIGSGAQTIALQSQLPFITDQVEIDGTTQQSYVDRPLIELNGSDIGGDANGISIASDGSTVRGLSIVGFEAAGIASTAVAPSILDNWIGIKADGSTLGNKFGALLTGTDAIVVGNVISGNAFTGIKLAGDSGDSRNRVENNIIGYDPFLSVAAPNRDGISSDGSGRDLIQGNVIGGNTSEGIIITFNGAGNNVVRGNFIGTDPSGVLDLGNVEGIEIFGFSNVVEGNVIANSEEQGVLIGEGSLGNQIIGNEIRNNRVGIIAQPYSVTPISQNSIFANQQLGIDLLEEGDIFYEEGVTENDEDVDVYSNEEDANYGVNFPVINEATRSGSNIKIRGTLNSYAQNNFQLEFFGSEVADPSGFGEGKHFLGVTELFTDAAGNASFSIDLSNVVGANFVTATSTIVLPTFGNATSEFSKAVVVSELFLPDLRGSLFSSAPSALAPGSVTTLTYVLENIGQEVSPSSSVQFYLSRNSTITATDKLLGSEAVSSLAAGGNSGSQTKVLTLPEASDPFWQGNGTYYLGMIVDAADVVMEGNETNNANQGDGLDRASISVSGLSVINLKHDTIGLFNPTGLGFALKTSNLPGPPDLTKSLPNVSSTWKPIAGDWSND
ncbi:MAG: right-handed parallel beta-helix repeat-containing protein, partial [Pirellulales bacterium]